MPRIPCSGRSARGSVSYCGPPTAPSSTASAACASASVAVGQRILRRVVAGAADRRRLGLDRQAVAAQDVEHLDGFGDDFAADAVAGEDGDLHERQQARVARRSRFASNARIASACCSVRPMSSRPFSRQCLRKGSTSKPKRKLPSAEAHRLPLEVDGQREAGERPHRVEQPVDRGLGQHDRQQAVLVAVVEEDVGVRRRDQRPEAVVGQRPGRVLARAAAAEVAPREQDRRALVARLVEHELRVQRPLRVVHPGLAAIEVAPFVEQVRAEARALDRLQELLGDDRVGVDVGAVERRHEPGQDAERLHRISTSWPGRRTSRWRRRRP